MSNNQRDEKSQSHHHEEWETSYSRCVPSLWHQDVQDRQGLTVIQRGSDELPAVSTAGSSRFSSASHGPDSEESNPAGSGWNATRPGVIPPPGLVLEKRSMKCVHQNYRAEQAEMKEANACDLCNTHIVFVGTRRKSDDKLGNKKLDVQATAQLHFS